MEHPMRTTILIGSALAAMLALPAQAQPNACLRFGLIDDWHAVNSRTLVVRDTSRHWFRVGLMGSCPEVRYSEHIAIKSPGSSTLSCVSPGDTVIVHSFGPGLRERCAISTIAPYSPQQEKEDRASHTY